MIFTTTEKGCQQLLSEGKPLLKAAYANGRLVDAWFGETTSTPGISTVDDILLTMTDNGLFGRLELALPESPTELPAIVTKAYLRLFDRLAEYSSLTVIRYWNFVPDITRLTGSGETIYELFNAGRYQAFQDYYASRLETMAIPAASAVGTSEPLLRIEFLAVAKPLAMIENKDQVPAYRYSERYGKRPPFFSRGVIFDNLGQRLLLSSGTASITGEDSRHPGDVYEQLGQSIHNLRILGSQFNLKRYDIHYGFALEDVRILRVYYRQETDLAFLQRFVPKFFPPSTIISFQQADICREELLVELEAIFVKKGETEQGVLPKYHLRQGQIRTESFEVHVTEHCNLKCRDCCNISPFNAKKFITLEEIKDICRFVNDHFQPDVFKIAGGEPTLHPQLDEIVKIVKGSGQVVRVISNGLLLHRMNDVFWQHIDQLTISNYISAPVKPHLLDAIRQKARQYEVVLNIKFVEQFNEIFVDDAIEDETRIRQIYDDCWMRHRCLIIRNGRFYKCTRAAYMDDFLALKGKPIAAGESTYSREDGIALDDTDFKNKAVQYLNDKQPLNSCEYCLGVSGGLRENIQLKLRVR